LLYNKIYSFRSQIVESLRNKLIANLQFMKIKIEFAPDHDGPSNYELVEIMKDDEIDRQTFMKKLKEENVKKLE
jgi:dTDP-4-amino-4,6-dideoxygalactose transaminase